MKLNLEEKPLIQKRTKINSLASNKLYFSKKIVNNLLSLYTDMGAGVIESKDTTAVGSPRFRRMLSRTYSKLKDTRYVD